MADRVVIDTNIIISALVFGGEPEKLIEKIIQENIKVFTSVQLIAELVDVLRKKFVFSEDKIKILENEIIDKFEIVYPQIEITVCRDNADNRVLEAGIEGKCNFIITGDKDLLVLKKYKNIKIMSATEFLNKFY